MVVALLTLMNWIITSCVLAAGCTDGDCVDDLCPDVRYATARVGPCESANNIGQYTTHCTYTYDAGLLALVDCKLRYPGQQDVRETSSWFYDANGQPLSIKRTYNDPNDDISLYLPVEWTFTVDRVTVASASSVERTYDRATFAFLPAMGSELVSPAAELGLLTRYTSTTGMTIGYRWTMAGSTQTRTGSNGDVSTFELDDRGRITSFIEDNRIDTHTFVFDGDYLVTRRFEGLDPTFHASTSRVDTFTYDRGGNLAVSISSYPEGREVYDYSCW